MNKQEKLIILLIFPALLGRFGGFARDMYLARTYMGEPPLDVETFWRNLSYIFDGMVNIGSAVWVFAEAKAASLKAWVWSLLGLLFGLAGVVLFYAAQIYGAKYAREA